MLDDGDHAVTRRRRDRKGEEREKIGKQKDARVVLARNHVAEGDVAVLGAM